MDRIYHVKFKDRTEHEPVKGWYIDDEHGLRPERRQHRIPVPRSIRLIDRRTRGIYGLRPHRGKRGQEESRTGAAKSSHTPAECGSRSTFSQEQE